MPLIYDLRHFTGIYSCRYIRVLYEYVLYLNLYLYFVLVLLHKSSIEVYSRTPETLFTLAHSQLLPLQLHA